MPELPEVETVRRQLQQGLVGKTIKTVTVLHPKTVRHNTAIKRQLAGRTIQDIDRVGKLMIFSFTDAADLFLLAHLKMTGQFFVTDQGAVTGGGHSMTARDVAVFPGPHTRLSMIFTDGTELHFNDMRLFGYVATADSAAVAAARAAFGPEPIARGFDCAWFVAALRKRRTSVKAALLDQSFVAGLGNIYVDEALFRAGIRPERRADQVSDADAARLCRAARAVLLEAIRYKGTTFQHFKDTAAQKGNFTNRLRVFGRQGQPCRSCGTVIEKTRVAGRGTHYCPTCQK